IDLRKEMIEVNCIDRLGKMTKVRCSESDTIGDLKELVADQVGTSAERIILKKWYTVFKDHICLRDYEITHLFEIEIYYK
uniref:Ubiquitin-like protein 5 n=1 Tax=Ciona savignyi TaxID=51511 RepID=H2YK69_CIOSA